MTLDDLKKELEQDLPITLTDMQYEAANNPILYGKWLRYLAQFRLDHKKASNEKVKASSERFKFYTGRSEDDICPDHYDKTELRIIMPADETIMKADTKMAYLEIMIEFAKGALDAIKNRGFAIKHVIEQRQLEAGR